MGRLTSPEPNSGSSREAGSMIRCGSGSQTAPTCDSPGSALSTIALAAYRWETASP